MLYVFVEVVQRIYFKVLQICCNGGQDNRGRKCLYRPMTRSNYNLTLV